MGFQMNHQANGKFKAGCSSLIGHCPDLQLPGKDQSCQRKGRSPGNRHITGNFPAFEKLEVTMHTFRCPLDCWDTLWLMAVMAPQASDSACQSPSPTYNS